MFAPELGTSIVPTLCLHNIHNIFYDGGTEIYNVPTFLEFYIYYIYAYMMYRFYENICIHKY